MPVRLFQKTLTVTAGAYSANDVVGGLITFTGLRQGTLQSIKITDNSAQSVDYLLVLFSDTPTDITDNATYDIADADLIKILHEEVITAAAFRRAFTDNAIYTVPELDVPLIAQCASLSGFLITTGTPTYAATTDISVTLQVDTDYVSSHTGRNKADVDNTPSGSAGGSLTGNYPDPALTTDAVDAITEIAAALKSGADAKLVTGTAGTAGNVAEWNSDGDLVDSSTVSADFFTVTFSRDVSTASGTQAVTGVSFIPRHVTFVMLEVAAPNAVQSYGWDDGTVHLALFNQENDTTGAWSNSSTDSIFAVDSATATYRGEISSLDADGFTITWTKGGTPTGTIIIFAKCDK